MRPLRVALLLLLAANAFALDVPPPPTQWFTDNARIVDAAQASALNEKLRNFETQSGAQFIIYIFPSLEGESMEDFTIRCAEKWKVGNKKYDNGLILFVFVKERKVRVEVGYGLEGTITDAVSSRVIRNDIAPHFQQQDYAGGLNAAADDLIAHIQGKETPVEPVRPASQPSRSSDQGFNVQCGLLLLVLFFVFVLPFLAIGRRRRGSGCGGGGCFWPLFFLGGGRGITFGGGGGGWGGGGGFGGFSGGGGSFGGGGASGGW